MNRWISSSTNVTSTGHSRFSRFERFHDLGKRTIQDIIESIEKDVTNPIGSSLNANPFNSKELMNKWRRQIENLAGILVRFIYISWIWTESSDSQFIETPLVFQARIHGLFCGLNEWKDDGTMAKNIRKLEKVLNEFEGSFKVRKLSSDPWEILATTENYICFSWTIGLLWHNSWKRRWTPERTYGMIKKRIFSKRN